MTSVALRMGGGPLLVYGVEAIRAYDGPAAGPFAAVND